MPFVPKVWRDLPDTSTPISAAALINEFQRVGDYAESLDDRSNVQVVTGNLAINAEEAGILPVPRSSRFLRVVADRACRIRVYSTAADRDADAGRLVGVDPADNAGVIAEWVLPTATGSLDIRCQPQPSGSNFDVGVVDQLYYRIQNQSVGASQVTVAFTIQRTE